MKKMVGNFLALAALVMMASASAFAYGGNAVIIYNPSNGQWASFHGANDRVSAEVGAMNENANLRTDIGSLESGAAGIRETYATNGWVALAKGNNGQNVVYGTSGSPYYNAHDSEYDAERSALENCGGSDNGCYVVRSLSSFVNYPDQDGVRNN